MDGRGQTCQSIIGKDQPTSSRMAQDIRATARLDGKNVRDLAT